MRLSRTVAAACCAVLALTMAPGSAAASGAGDRSPAPHQDTPASVDDTTTDREAAEQALAAVVAAFTPDGASQRGTPQRVEGGDLTMTLLELRRRLADLAPADRAVARSYLARPTHTDAASLVAYRPEGNPATQCGERVCVTYATSGRDAPPTTDQNGNGVPDQVELTRQTVNHVWSRVVTQGRYRAPLADGGYAAGEGPDGRFDIYLVDLAGTPYYGYCVPDEQGAARPRVASGYCVLDDDYARSQFPLHTPKQNLQVTVAHEFFHAVQFAYDLGEDTWFMEGTAAWVEDEIYDAVNDNRQYLQASPLTHPAFSLDNPALLGNPYGSWIWWRFLAERHPWEWGSGMPTVIRSIWEKAADTADGTHSMQATARALSGRRDSLRGAFARFSAVNRHPRTFYEEGWAYPTAPLVRSYRLTPATRSVPWQAFRLRQNSSTTVAFTPDRRLGLSPWRLRVRVDTPDRLRGSSAQLSVHLRNGRIVTHTVRLAANGTGGLTVGFSRRTVKRVELTVANGSGRYWCNHGSSYSCGGKPRDNNLLNRFTAQLLR